MEVTISVINNLLIYICGSDLESEKGYASSNIDDLLSASLRPNDNIYLLTGGISSWKMKIYLMM